VQDDDVSTAATSATRAPSARFNLFIQGAAAQRWQLGGSKWSKIWTTIAYNL